MKRLTYNDVYFTATNESLDAITKSLNIGKDDRIISICGCSAQPLAFLEYILMVLVIYLQLIIIYIN